MKNEKACKLLQFVKPSTIIVLFSCAIVVCMALLGYSLEKKVENEDWVITLKNIMELRDEIENLEDNIIKLEGGVAEINTKVDIKETVQDILEYAQKKLDIRIQSIRSELKEQNTEYKEILTILEGKISNIYQTSTEIEERLNSFTPDSKRIDQNGNND